MIHDPELVVFQQPVILRAKNLERVAAKLGIKGTVWKVASQNYSTVIGEEGEFDFNQIPYPGARWIIYNGGFKGQVKKERIPKHSTWAQLWVIADRLILSSGDGRHTFIEAIDILDTETDILQIVTGS